MDHTLARTTTQHNPYPLTTPYSSIYATHPHHQSYLQPPTTQNPNPNPIHTILPPPGVDSYTYLHAHQAQAAVDGYSYPTPDSGSLATAPTVYYQDPNAHNWAAVIEAVRQYGVDPVAAYGSGVTIPPTGTEQSVTVIPNSTLWTNPAVQPRGNGTWKRLLKKTKVVQSMYCEICKVDCSSRVVYEYHVLGKRHKKSMEKLNEAVAPASTSLVSSNPMIGPLEKAISDQKPKKKAAESLQDLETKRRKVLEGGAAAHAVRSCTICNVVCNSDTVFSHHLSGQKHAAMVKKYSTTTGLTSKFIL